MRIVGGEFRGRTIEAPKGDRTRPTTDRVREALMSSLVSLRGGLDGAVVLDAFAGSGALGLEVLSRGARAVVLCESDRNALAVIRRNVERCVGSATASDAVRVVSGDVMRQLPVTVSPYDMVFLDPPYAMKADAVIALPHELMKRGMLDPNALVVYEHALERDAEVRHAAESAGFTVRVYKKYGKTGVAILVAAHEDSKSEEEESGI